MFLTRIGTISAASEDRSPTDDFWFQPVSRRSMSGAIVTADSAMRLSAVWRAINLISGHIAMLPLELRKAGTRKRVAEHPVYALFRRPNPWQNGFEWRQMLTGHLLLRGNAYSEITEDASGAITALTPRHPDKVSIEMLPSGSYRYRVTDPDGRSRFLARNQMWHLRGLSSNGITGMSVIESARESMGLGIAAQSYGARYFNNDAKPTGGWIEYPGRFADKAARTMFRDSVQAAQGDANRGKMMVLDSGMKYHEVGISNKDGQFLESRQFQISEIARWFGIPPHKLADLSRATFSNIEQQSLEYIHDGLLYWSEVWKHAIESDILFDHEKLEAEFSFSKLLRGDSTARYGNYAKGIAAGWLTRNEAREDDGREPLDGLDEPLRPLNMVEEAAAEDEESDAENAEDAEDAKSPAPESDEPKAPEKADDPAESASRFAALLHNNAARLARRMIKSGEPASVDLIAESLAVSRATASTWIAGSAAALKSTSVADVTAELITLASQP